MNNLYTISFCQRYIQQDTASDADAIVLHLTQPPVFSGVLHPDQVIDGSIHTDWPLSNLLRHQP